MRKRRSLILVLVLVSLVIALGGWVLYGRDQRASIAILGDGDFFEPELRMSGWLVPAPAEAKGPWRFYAWADLNPRLEVTNVTLSWTGADGRRRTLRDVMHHNYEGYQPHCAYLLRLDAAGDPIRASPGFRADQLTRFCHG